MAGRIRSIKPELLEDEKAAQLSDAAWRLFVSMWTLADDFGNLRAGIKYLSSQVWQDSTRDCTGELSELASNGMIKVYENDGQKYVQIVNWAKHQRIDNAGKRKVPSPSEPGSAYLGAVSRQQCHGNNGSPRGVEGSRQGVEGSRLDRRGEDRIGKERKARVAREPDPVLVEVFEHYLEHWRRVIGGPKAPILSSARESMIRARLSDGFKPDQLKQAIDGLWSTTFNLEHGHTGIEIALRNIEQVEKYSGKSRAQMSTRQEYFVEDSPSDAGPPPAGLLELFAGIGAGR